MSIIHEPVQTPWGTIALQIIEAHGQRVALLSDQHDPRAAIYAAKQRAIQRLVEIVPAWPLDRLLAAPAVIAPHDLLDLTLGRPTTFFTGKGYGFLPQQPVFCPELRRSYLDALADPSQLPHGARGFRRATLAVLDEPEPMLDPRWGAQLGAQQGAPAAFLARELELCYAPLCVIGEVPAPERLIERALHTLPSERSCPCATAMRATRERGLVGDDWRTWIAEVVNGSDRAARS